MIAATATLEFVTTKTETEALLLEANLIKRLRPRFNVLLRDDKSFPYILITSDHWAPQILKHRGARRKPGRYYGPFASAGAVNRTINALERAFLLDPVRTTYFEARTRPGLLYQMRCSAPCTREIDFPGYAELVKEANEFLSGRSRSVQGQLADEMDKASAALDFEGAAMYRDRLSALSAIQSHQGINPRNVEEADVFAVHQVGGYTCVEVFFFRTGQNWGNRAYFPKADRAIAPDEILGAFLAQFYDDAATAAHSASHEFGERAFGKALSAKSDAKSRCKPNRGERGAVQHALAIAAGGACGKLADTSSQQKLLRADRVFVTAKPRCIEARQQPHRWCMPPSQAMIVAGAEGFRKINIGSSTFDRRISHPVTTTA
jgi:excinuclease ABC subunit C